MRKIIKEQRSRNNGRGPITKEQVRQAILKLNKRTAVGEDQWSPAVWRDMSEDAMEELVSLLSEVEHKG